MDQAQNWTMVAQDDFSTDGVLRAIELYVGATGRRLRFGIFRPRNIVCSFTLVSQVEFSNTSLPLGYHVVRHSDEKILWKT